MGRNEVMWLDAGIVQSKSFTCGHCGEKISSDRGYRAQVGNLTKPLIYICHACNRPTFLFYDEQVPAAALGNPVASLPEDVAKVYKEARKCTSVGAYTSAVMAARKLIMHIAVEKGATPGQTFVQYVDHLADAGFVPPNGRGWVDKVRRLGNDANHQLTIMEQKDAELVLKFLEMLLKFIYEFPAVEQELDSEPTT